MHTFFKIDLGCELRTLTLHASSLIVTHYFTLRRLQASDITLLKEMKNDTRFCNFLTALSECDLRFPTLQARCRKIFVPVGTTLGLGFIAHPVDVTLIPTHVDTEQTRCEQTPHTISFKMWNEVLDPVRPGFANIGLV